MISFISLLSIDIHELYKRRKTRQFISTHVHRKGLTGAMIPALLEACNPIFRIVPASLEVTPRHDFASIHKVSAILGDGLGAVRRYSGVGFNRTGSRNGVEGLVVDEWRDEQLLHSRFDNTRLNFLLLLSILVLI